MKSIGMLSVIAMALFGWMTSYAQKIDAEVPGDHFSLEGALELFKKSSSPEEFEKLLNSPGEKVNNLDLNGDGYIDYIRVFDRHEGNIHAFIIQAVVSDNENQDVAVIELEKLANGKAVLQIIGDEDIYGIETIIEPTREVRTYAGAQSTRTVVNVWGWPSVQYVYGPYYSGWWSPWGWHLRPVWWRPWRPVAYVYYYPVWRPYRSYYSTCHTYRIAYAHEIYRPHRSTSVIVYNRHRGQVDRYRTAHSDQVRHDRNTGSRSDASRNTGRGSERDRRDNGRSSGREAVSSTGRTQAADRTSSREIRQNTSGREIEAARHTRSDSDPAVETRQRVRRSADGRTLTTDGRRQVVTERSTPDIQRLDNERQLNGTRERTSATSGNSRERRHDVSAPAGRSSSGNIQQRSAAREQRVPVQQNSTAIRQRNDSPARGSGNVRNRESRPQVSRPSGADRGRSSGSVQRPGPRDSGSRSGGKGRD